MQRGFRGTGMEQVYNPRTMAGQAALNVAPEALPAASADGPKAGEVYQNLKVLGGQSVGQFVRTMTAMTSWVAPQQGCAYCHNLQNMADDSLYTKGRGPSHVADDPKDQHRLEEAMWWKQA